MQRPFPLRVANDTAWFLASRSPTSMPVAQRVVLTDLKNDGVEIDCNNIGVANPLSTQAKRAK